MDLRKDTLFFDALVDFPTYGQEDKLYLDKANGALYYWDGSAYALAGDGTGGVTAVTATAPIASSGGATPDISITQANGSTDGYLSSADWTTFNGKQNALTLTTTGTSGAATLVGSTLNIPQYLSGLTYFTEAQNTSAPNATVNVDSLTAVASTTNADFVIRPKGTGAILAQIPDNTTTGGNKRGAGAIDLQTERVSADQVASGGYSVTLGFRNKASNSAAIALGQSNSVTQANGTSIGYFNSNDGITGCTAIGWSNTITSGGNYGALAIGQQNGVSGQGFAIGVQNSVSNGVALGTTNTASAGIALGTSNTVDAGASTAIGKQASVFSIKGRLAHSAGQVAVLGDSQTSKFILQNRTTNNTATTLVSDAVASPTPFSNNQVILSNQSAYAFEGKIIGKQSGSTNAAVWKVEGLIVRGSNAASTVLTASTVTLFSNLPGWGTPTLAADTTNGGLQIQVSGLAATNIQWTAVIETTEVIYA